MASQNSNALDDCLRGYIRRRLKTTMIARGRARFEAARNLMIEEILNHPISKELDSHEEPSSFLSGASGTLFGFMGFVEGTDPVQDLINAVNDYTTFIPSPNLNSKLQHETLIRFPTERKMLQEGLEMPWLKGISWPRAIEKGISGLPYYLNVIHPNSLSQEGIEAKFKGKKGGKGGLRRVRSAKFESVDYLTPIFSDFVKRVRSQKAIF